MNAVALKGLLGRTRGTRGDGRARPMIRVALKGLWGRKLRTVLTALAIVLGVSMISGTYVLTDTITASFTKVVDGLLSLSRGGLDLRGLRQERTNLADELRRSHARLCGDLDLVELAGLVEEVLRSGDVEDGDRRRSDRRGG